jgi:prepilin-type N-terminal cleavage/methylation domain-containing protein
MNTHRQSIGRGFTLVELLVVILIIVLVSAATLPFLVPAITHRQVSEGARILQAALAGARDEAIHADAPRGIRLLSDPVLNSATGAFASNRFIPIEPGPDYFEGRVAIKQGASANPNFSTTIHGGMTPTVATPDPPLAIRIEEDRLTSLGTLAERTNWYWNLRLGDKIRLTDSGRYYTIVGPYWSANPEAFVNVGPPGTISPLLRPYPLSPNPLDVEYLLLVNGQDDNQNGYVDEGFDGINNNYNINNYTDNLINGVVDPALTDFLPIGTAFPQGNPPALSGEWEVETFIGPTDAVGSMTGQNYHVLRRPVPSPGARETTLPADVVIDMTTLVHPVNKLFNPNSERSRLPIDLVTGFVDIMIAPGGQALQSGASSNAAPSSVLPFYHFWVAERADVMEPALIPGSPLGYFLPMPQGATNYPSGSDPNPRFLKGERRLVTLFPKTGQLTTNSIESFDANPAGTFGSAAYFYASMPFLDAQAGRREEIR